MAELLDGLVADFVEAALDPEVGVPDVAMLAQEVDVAAGLAPETLARAATGIAPLLEADGPVLYIAAVLLGGLVERGAPAAAGERLVRRLPAWVEAAAGPAEAEATARALGDLSEVWRPLVAVLGADAALRAGVVPLIEAIDAIDLEGAAWLAHLLRAGERRAIAVWGPERSWARRGEVQGVADVLQLTLLVHGGLGADVPAEALACARGDGPAFLPVPVELPYVLTDAAGDPLPEGMELSALADPVSVHVRVRAQPELRPAGRAFATLGATLDVDLGGLSVD